MKLNLIFILSFFTYFLAIGQSNKREDILKVTVDDYSLSIPGFNKVLIASNKILLVKKETLVIIDDKIYDNSNFRYLNIDSTQMLLIQVVKDSTSKSLYKEVFIYKTKH